MKKMESKKVQRPRWLDSLFGPKNSNSQWLEENLEEMNRNFRRMLTIIEDSNAVSFAKKFEMYDQSRQELINLVDKCYRIHCLLAERYNHELLNNIPNSGLISSQGTSNVSSGKISLPLLSKPHSSKQSNDPVSSVGSRQLKRGVSSIGNNIRRIRMMVRLKPGRDSSSSNFSNYYSDTQSVGDGGEEEELEAELHDMIVKLYIQLEGDRVDKALLEEKLDLNVRGLQSQQPVKISTRPPPLPPIIRSKSQSESESDDSFSSSNYSDTQNNDDDGDELGHDELEAELHNMIEKLYMELEWDRVVSMFQGDILKYEDNTHDDDEEFISSNVDKALLEENLKLQAEISRLLKEMSYLKGYNEEIEAIVAERNQLKARVARLTVDLRMYLEGINVNPCSPI